MRVRPATPDDAPVLQALESSCFGAEAWSATTVAEELAASDRCWFLAVEDDEVLGYACTNRVGDLVDLQRVAVHPDRRGTGLGRQLLEAALDRAQQDDAEAVLLEVSARNSAAVSLYAAAGFVEISRRRRYYRDGSDAVVMRRGTGTTSEAG